MDVIKVIEEAIRRDCTIRDGGWDGVPGWLRGVFASVGLPPPKRCHHPEPAPGDYGAVADRPCFWLPCPRHRQEVMSPDDWDGGADFSRVRTYHVTMNRHLYRLTSTTLLVVHVGQCPGCGSIYYRALPVDG
jgi:hypothetical protein